MSTVVKGVSGRDAVSKKKLRENKEEADILSSRSMFPYTVAPSNSPKVDQLPLSHSLRSCVVFVRMSMCLLQIRLKFLRDLNHLLQMLVT